MPSPETEPKNLESRYTNHKKKPSDHSNHHGARKSDIEKLEHSLNAVRRIIRSLATMVDEKPPKTDKEKVLKRSRSLLQGSTTINNKLNATDVKTATPAATATTTATTKQSQALEHLENIAKLSGAIFQSQENKIQSLQRRIEELSTQLSRTRQRPSTAPEQHNSSSPELCALEARVLVLEARNTEQACERRISEQAARRMQGSLQQRIQVLEQANAGLRTRVNALEGQEAGGSELGAKKGVDARQVHVGDGEQRRGVQGGLRKTRSLLRRKSGRGCTI